MLIVVVGPVASATTWTFNIVRKLLVESAQGAVSVYAERANDLLKNLPSNSKDVLVKAHVIDYAMLRCLELCNARVIVTHRDPRDCLVSQRTRFGIPTSEVINSLSQSFATLAEVRQLSDNLYLCYEDGFATNVETLEKIASFLELNLNRDVLDRIFESMRPENIREEICRWEKEGWVDNPGNTPELNYDAGSHWHFNHLGDGRVGKWKEHLTSSESDTVFKCFPGGFVEKAWLTSPIQWNAQLFKYFDDRVVDGAETLSVSGEEKTLVYGPYLHLPTGRWRIKPLVRAASRSIPITLRIDVLINVSGRGVLQMRVFSLPTDHTDRTLLEFDNIDHMHPIEVRLSSIDDGRCSSFVFSGVELSWVGPIDHDATCEARPVS